MDLITTPVGSYSPTASAVVHITSANLINMERGEPVHLRQYDQSVPVIAVELYVGQQPYSVPDGAAVNIRMEKPDGKHVYNPAKGVSNDRQTAYFDTTAQMTAAFGSSDPIVEIVIAGGVAGTAAFHLDIDENPVPEDAYASTDEYKTIQQLAGEVTGAAQTVTDNLPAINSIQNNIDAIKFAVQNEANISAVGSSIENVNTVAENLDPVQTAAENMEAIKQAPRHATNAAASATLSESWAAGSTGTRDGENTNNAKYWAEEAQKVAQGAVGWYQTESALTAAHPTGKDGQWAIVGDTDTVWTWDSDTGKWKNSNQQPDMSRYYQKQEADQRFQMPIGYVFEWASVPDQSVDLSSPEKVAQYFGYGTWAAFGEGLFLLGNGGGYQAGNTGGEAKHTLTKAELPNEKINVNIAIQSGPSGNADYARYNYDGYSSKDNIITLAGGFTDPLGSGQAHNNMPPYIVVYRWQRIA